MSNDTGQNAKPVTPHSDAAESMRAQLDDARRELEQAETHRQAARDRATVLQGELQHRVRNMLATIRSVFSRTVAFGGSLEDVADHFNGRLDALARYESAHVTDPGRTVDLEQIVRDELHSFQFGDDPKIRIAGPEVRLGRDVAQSLALAMHELTTNAIKFGALSMVDDRATLDIAWTSTDDLVTITWVEQGVPIVASAPLRKGFGREFIEQALPYQLDAKTHFELHPGGISCSITLPPKAIATGLHPFT